MRIDTPTWVNISHATYQSMRLSGAVGHSRDALQSDTSLSIQALGHHPAPLRQLERIIAGTAFRGDWTARLWAVAPVPHYDTTGRFIRGWSEIDPDAQLQTLIGLWSSQAGRPIEAIRLTWICFQVPAVEHLVDLTSLDAQEHTHITATSVFVLGQPLAIRRYQYRHEPPIHAAYDPASRTLYCLT
jgi:hypothetical protein